MSPPDPSRPRAATIPPMSVGDLPGRVRDLEHGHDRLQERVGELLEESRKMNGTLTAISEGLSTVNTERKEEKDRKKWWDGVTRGVLIALVVALAAWVAHIAMVTQTARFPSQ